MAEIRHDRPILKYLDNLRRENQRASMLEHSPTLQPKTDKSAPRRLQQPRNETAYTRHIETFDLLPELSKAAIGQILDDANALNEARMVYIESIGSRKHTGKRKAKYDEAYASLRAACAAYNVRCKAELRDGKSISREWWARLRVVMGAEWEPFEEIDEFIKETRLA